MSEPAASPATTDAPAALDYAATQIVQTWKYTSPLMACRFDPTGKILVSSAQDRQLQRWDLASGEMTPLLGHQSWLRAIDFSPDGQTLYSAGYDGLLCCWKLHDPQPEPFRSITAHDGWVRWLSVSPDGQLLATGGNDQLVKLWRADDGQLVQTFAGHEAHVYSTLFHPSGTWLLSGDLLGKIHQWDLASGSRVRSFNGEDLHDYNGGQGAHYGGVRSMTLSPDGRFLAASGLHKATNPFGAVQEPLVLVFDWESGDKLKSLVADKITGGIAWRAIYHPAGPLIGVSGGSSGGFLLFWEPNNEQTVSQFKLPNTALDMDLHPEGTQVATVHYDRQVRLSQLQLAGASTT